MKIVSITVIGVSLTVWAISPLFRTSKVTSQRRVLSPEAVAKRQAQKVAIDEAYQAFESGNPSRIASVKKTIGELTSGDPRRWRFAAIMDNRGDDVAAYNLEKVRVHFLEQSTPDDNEMRFYAKVARRAGDLDEANWAERRMGTIGHFRIWEHLMEGSLDYRRWPRALGRAQYVRTVRLQLAAGLQQYPGFAEEVTRLRARLLATSN